MKDSTKKKIDKMLDYFARVPSGSAFQSQGTVQDLCPSDSRPGTKLAKRASEWAETKGLEVAETEGGWRFTKR